jgi:DNA-binding transcriptional LysR family regulator
VELRHLRYFHALAEELHFTRAADRMHVVQSALSRQVAALEQELGVRLFDRTSRGVQLTVAGRALKERVAAILPTLDEALDMTRLTASGEIGRLEIGFIAAAMWSVLPAILQEHRRRHPHVLFRLHELPMAGEQLEPLLDGSLDVVFVRPFARFRTVAFLPLFREQFVAALPEGHRLATSERVDLAELADERFVLMSRTAYPDAHDLFTQACLNAGFTPMILDEGDSPNAMYLVASGLGVALAPASAMRSGLPGIAFRPLTDPTPEVQLAAAYRRSNPSKTLAALLETAANVAASDDVEPSRQGLGGSASSRCSTVS